MEMIHGFENAVANPISQDYLRFHNCVLPAGVKESRDFRLQFPVTFSDTLAQMLRRLLGFYWLTLKEHLQENRLKRLKAAWAVIAFIMFVVIADLLGIPLINPLKWVYHLIPNKAWVIIGLLLVIAFQCFLIEGARRVYERTRWLRDLAESDRQDISAAVRITGCELEMDLETDHAWVGFRCKVFNGSIFPIAVKEVGGFIAFSNGPELRKLEGNLTIRPQLSAENCQRLRSGLFYLRQELSKKDVTVISASSSASYFTFHDLIISVKAKGEAFDGLSTGRLPTTVDDVQPRLSAAFRHDVSVLEAKARAQNKVRLERIRLLSEVIGRAKELIRVQNAPEFIPLEDMKSLASEIEMALHHCYGNNALKEFYPFNFKGERLEGPNEYSLGPREWFVEYLNRLVVILDREESEAAEEAGRSAAK